LRLRLRMLLLRRWMLLLLRRWMLLRLWRSTISRRRRMLLRRWTSRLRTTRLRAPLLRIYRRLTTPLRLLILDRLARPLLRLVVRLRRLRPRHHRWRLDIVVGRQRMSDHRHRGPSLVD
jgi:hypothetical protein